MLHVVLSKAIFWFLSASVMRAELEGKRYFGFRSEPSFQSEPVYYIPAPLQYVFWWLWERLHQQNDGVRQQAGVLDISRSNLFTLRCLSCRWHVIPHRVHFSKIWNPCQRWENRTPVCCLNSGMNVSVHLSWCSAQIQDGGRPLRLSAPQQCLCPDSVWNGMSAHQ